MTERPVIMAFAPNPWCGPWMNRQQILSRLAARGWDVLYSNGLWTTWDLKKTAFQEAKFFGETRLLDGVYIHTAPKWLLNYSKSGLWARSAYKLGSLVLRQALGVSHKKRLVAYVFHPKFAPLCAHLKPDFLVYHAYDLPYGPESEAELRRKRMLLEMADVVVASSPAIAEHLTSIRPRQSVDVIPNGADTEAYISASKLAEPEDICAIPSPRIGYIGNLNRKVDFRLVAKLAREKPLWNFVFVGGEGNFDDASRRGLDSCKARRNVFFVGEKHYTELPRYANAMDVNIMCYRMDRDLWTVGGYPLKLHEYLAAGKPVVSADLQSIRPFSAVVHLCNSDEEWESALARAIAQRGVGDTLSRRAVAKENDWNVRVDRIESLLELVPR
jgi:glycosyltransferase involved in cell wall biosynthesis